MKKRVRIYKAGGQTNEIDNNMENPEQQMPQGNPEAMQQQGQPQQGGQDQQMQQIMQFVQQMLQQGAQPADIAAQLLERQVPPEVIMQIFVQMGMQEAEAQQTIQAAMQNGQPQQQQGQGEEQMEGQASNPQEEQQEQQGPPPTQPGAQMSYGGGLQRRQPLFAEGGNVDQDELDTVVKNVEAWMSSDVDTDTIIQRITQQAQDGDISPEVAQVILAELSTKKQASDPSGSDVAMQSQSNDPQVYTPEMGAPDQQMGYSKFGGNLKRLLTKAYGGSTAAPEERSKNYAADRTNMFLDTIKNNTYKSILNGSFNRDGSVNESYTSPTMSYGGGIPKAVDGINLKDGKVVIDPTQYKSEAEYKAAALDWNYAHPENTVGMDLYKANPWKAPEVAKVDKATYTWDEASKSFKPAAAATTTTTTNTGGFKAGDILGQDGYGSYVTHADGTMQRLPAGGIWENPPGAYTQQYGGYGQGNFNPVAYGRPGNTLFDQLYSGANPAARFFANSGNRYSDVNVKGDNLPGGMTGEQFLAAVGKNGLFPGMAGTIGDQSWRIAEGEEYKTGNFFNKHRTKGTKFKVDWGNTAAMNPASAGKKDTYMIDGKPVQMNDQELMQYLDKSKEPPATEYQQYVDKFKKGQTDQGLEWSDAENKWVPSASGTPANNLGMGVIPNKSNQTAFLSDPTKQAPAAISNGENMIYNDPNSPNAPNAPITQDPNTVATNTPVATPATTAIVDPRQQIIDLEKQRKDLQEAVNMAKTNLSKQNPNAGLNTQSVNSRKYPEDDYPNEMANETRASMEMYKQDAIDKQNAEIEQQASDKYFNGYQQNVDKFKKDQADQGLEWSETANQWVPQGQDADIKKTSKLVSRSFQNGGAITNEALHNAIHLINRAYGGKIPKAWGGGNVDKNGNKIPDYLEIEDQPSIGENTGTLDTSVDKERTWDWNSFGDVYYDKFAPQTTNIMNKANAAPGVLANEIGRQSAINDTARSFESQSQGIYDQQGNWIPNNIGNQNIHGTNSNFADQNQISKYGGNVFKYGGKVYEMGDVVDLTKEELAELRAAGVNLTQVNG